MHSGLQVYLPCTPQAYASPPWISHQKSVFLIAFPTKANAFLLTSKLPTSEMLPALQGCPRTLCLLPLGCTHSLQQNEPTESPVWGLDSMLPSGNKLSSWEAVRGGWKWPQKLKGCYCKDGCLLLATIYPEGKAGGKELGAGTSPVLCHHPGQSRNETKPGATLPRGGGFWARMASPKDKLGILHTWISTAHWHWHKAWTRFVNIKGQMKLKNPLCSIQPTLGYFMGAVIDWKFTTI